MKRRSAVIGALLHEAAIFRLVGGALLQQDEERSVHHTRYTSQGTIAAMATQRSSVVQSWTLADAAPAKIAMIDAPQLHHGMGQSL